MIVDDTFWLFTIHGYAEKTPLEISEFSQLENLHLRSWILPAIHDCWHRYGNFHHTFPPKTGPIM